MILSHPSNIFFVRHAETHANVSNIYNFQNESIFSENGLRQIEVMTNVLKNYNFNYIISSPTWRTQNTILPYLVYKNGGIKGEIWPELTECCWQHDQTAPVPSDGINVPQGAFIKLENELYFKYRDEESMREYEWPSKTYADGIVQTKKAADMIRARFGGKGMNVLVVIHSVSGFHVTKELSGIGYHLSNADLIYYQESFDGSFIRKPLHKI